MGVAIFSLSLAGMCFRFSFLVFLGLSLGISIYFIMKKPQLWRIWPLTYLDFDEPPISRRCVVIASLITALPFMIFAYTDTWQHFYKISQDSDRFYLHYPFPKGVIELTETGRLEFDAQYEIRRGFRITVVDKGRRLYSSQIMNQREAVENLAKMSDALKAYRSPNSKM